MLISSASVVQMSPQTGFQSASVDLSEANREISQKNSQSPDDLPKEDKQQLQKLQQTDREVRAHEQAHLSMASGIAQGGPSFSFVTGPDGKRYAVGGDVQIDVSEVADDPEATIKKAEQIKKAALAPASPSAQDQRVAASATAMMSKAQAEILKKNSPADEGNQSGQSIDFKV